MTANKKIAGAQISGSAPTVEKAAKPPVTKGEIVSMSKQNAHTPKEELLAPLPAPEQGVQKAVKPPAPPEQGAPAFTAQKAVKPPPAPEQGAPAFTAQKAAKPPKEEFLQLFDTHIKREGAGALRDYLLKSDFFTAPASARYHSAFEGGLCAHSINTYKRLLKLLADEDWGGKRPEKVSGETIAILGLLHDLCKIEYYKADVKNVKVGGEWTQQPFYTTDERLPYGHGEKSVYIINGFIRLTREEAVAINWHMGGFDHRVRGGSSSAGESYEKFPLALLLHTADLMATYIDENRGLGKQ